MGYIQVNKNKTFIYCQVNLGVWGRRKNHSYNALSLICGSVFIFFWYSVW